MKITNKNYMKLNRNYLVWTPSDHPEHRGYPWAIEAHGKDRIEIHGPFFSLIEAEEYRVLLEGTGEFPVLLKIVKLETPAAPSAALTKAIEHATLSPTKRKIIANAKRR